MLRHVQYNIIQNWNSLNTMTTDQYSSKSATADSMTHNKPLFFLPTIYLYYAHHSVGKEK